MARRALARAISNNLALSIFNSGDFSLLRGRDRAFEAEGDLNKILAISVIYMFCAPYL